MKKLKSTIIIVLLLQLSISSMPAYAGSNLKAEYAGGVVTVSGTGFDRGSQLVVRIVDWDYSRKR